MSAAFLGTELAQIQTGTSATWSHTLAAGDDRVVVAFVLWTTPADIDISGVTYGGVSMVQEGSQYQSGATGSSRAAMFVLEEASLPADGLKTVAPSWSTSNANIDVSMYVWCIEDCPSPVFTPNGVGSAGTGHYPATVTAAALAANSLLLTGSVHNDVSTGTLSCNIGTPDTELNTAAEIRSRTAYLLDTGASGDESAIWSVSSESGNTKASTVILGIEYTPAATPSTSEGWGILV